MNKEQFIETYCHNCGTQRCEGIGTEWFEGCPKRWNLNDYGDVAAEIERLNKKIMELGYKLMNKTPITKIKETDEKYDFADVKSSKHTRNRARTLRWIKRKQNRKVRRVLKKEMGDEE